MSNPVLATIFGVVVLFAIVSYVFYKKKQANPESNEEVKRFAKTLESVFETYILKYLKSLDFSSITNIVSALTITDVQIRIIKDLYNELYSVAMKELNNLQNIDEFTKKMIMAFLTKENIEAIANTVFGSPVIQEEFKIKYDGAIVMAANSHIGED